MRILMLQVGDPVQKNMRESNSAYMLMTCFNDGEAKWYLRKDIINATSQMESLLKAGVEIEYGFLTKRKSLLELIRAGFRLRRIVVAKRIQAVHVLWGSTTSFLAVIFSPVPVVISFCGSDLFGEVTSLGARTLSGRLSRWLSQISSMCAKHVIVKSEPLLKVLWGMSQSKCTIIPNGVDLELFQPMEKEFARARLGWKFDEKVVIFFPGEDSPVKDYPLAEQVMRLVQQSILNARVQLVRGVPHGELVYYYNAADAMLLTSFHEGSNNSVKEAMACNLPIVSVTCGDTKERLRGVRLSHVVEGRQPEVLAKKMIEVLKVGSRSDARSFVEDISLENIARRVVDVYESVVNGS